MSYPQIQPKEKNPFFILPATGTSVNVIPALPLGVYSYSNSFISGAVDQVSYVYSMLGGQVVDIEIHESDVYVSYEQAVLEYSYHINLYQSKNSLGSFLGTPTGSFNHLGQITSGSLSGSNSALKYPKFSLGYARNVSDEVSYQAGVGGTIPYYSASLDLIPNVQNYDLVRAVMQKADNGDGILAQAITASNHGQINVTKVYYKSPQQAWRFFGYYGGGLSVAGNLSSYGQYADDSTFDIVPVWQNKLQAINYETSLYTRTSHYSYEIKNNKINLFPVPQQNGMQKIWFVFSFSPDALSESDINSKTGINGVNNINSLPFENIPYESINSMGQQWIRKFSLAICKGILSQVRSKLSEIPIPGGSVTLNGDSLLSQSTEEMEKLREELKDILEQTSYTKIMEDQSNIMEMNAKVHSYVAKSIYCG